MALTAAASPSSFPQSSTGRFEVSRVLARSYRRMTNRGVTFGFRFPALRALHPVAAYPNLTGLSHLSRADRRLPVSQ